MSLVEWLAADPERCDHGYHRTAQLCPDCTTDTPPADEVAAS